MVIRYHKDFKKQVAKLQPTQRDRLKVALSKFVANPNDPSLYNHPLYGEWVGHRSISFGGDWRAHLIMVSDDEAIFVAAGTHSQLYK